MIRPHASAWLIISCTSACVMAVSNRPCVASNSASCRSWTPRSASSRCRLAAILCKLLDPGTRQRGLLLLRPSLDVNLLLSPKPIGLKITRLEEPQTQPSTSRRILQPSQDGEQQRQDTLKRCTEATTVVHTVHGWALRLWNRWRPPTRQNQSLTLWWRLRTEWTVGVQCRAMTYLSRLT